LSNNIKEQNGMQDYYLAKQKRLMQVFDFMFRPIEAKLDVYYGEEYARDIVHQSRENFVEIIPQLPYVGGMKNYYTPIIVINGMIIAMYRVMSESGKSAEDVICIWAESADDLFRRLPPWLAKLGGRALLSKPVVRGFRKQTAISQERRFPEDWVYELVEGEDFDVGFEFSECAVIKLYQTMDTMELAPYCNFADVTYSHYLGIGLDASETLGMGNERCRMHFKRGHETVITPNLAEVLPLAMRGGN
jgi:hypothetical protein